MKPITFKQRIGRDYDENSDTLLGACLRDVGTTLQSVSRTVTLDQLCQSHPLLLSLSRIFDNMTQMEYECGYPFKFLGKYPQYTSLKVRRVQFEDRPLCLALVNRRQGSIYLTDEEMVFSLLSQLYDRVEGLMGYLEKKSLDGKMLELLKQLRPVYLADSFNLYSIGRGKGPVLIKVSAWPLVLEELSPTLKSALARRGAIVFSFEQQRLLTSSIVGRLIYDKSTGYKRMESNMVEAESDLMNYALVFALSVSFREAEECSVFFHRGCLCMIELSAYFEHPKDIIPALVLFEKRVPLPSKASAVDALLAFYQKEKSRHSTYDDVEGNIVLLNESHSRSARMGASGSVYFNRQEMLNAMITDVLKNRVVVKSDVLETLVALALSGQVVSFIHYGDDVLIGAIGDPISRSDRALITKAYFPGVESVAV